MSSIDWNARYAAADTPWDSGLVSADLRCLTRRISSAGRKAVELGCGSGTNAVFLASSGFETTAVDVSTLAVNMAKQRAESAGVSVNFVCQDLRNWRTEPGSFDFLFDRACYHCLRREGLGAQYLTAAASILAPGGLALVLCGNCDSKQQAGPPKVSATDIVTDWEPRFEILELNATFMEDARHEPGFLGWSCLMRRRGE